MIKTVRLQPKKTVNIPKLLLLENQEHQTNSKYTVGLKCKMF